jgi:enoyl-CoA hydratase/carnithine racemase
VIAQVHGYALGSGLELALGCDLVVAAKGTVMGLIETTLAATPGGGGTQLLPRLIGIQRAKELILTGRRFTSDEAFEWGMFNYLVTTDELESKTRELVDEILRAAPIAVAQAKRAVNMSLDVSYEHGLQVEEALYERTLTTRDRAEALEAYRERRTPLFRGE